MKNTTMKIWIKTLSLVMAFVLGIGYICFSDGITANAASGNISSIPTTIKAYPISTGNNTPAYGYVGDTSKDGTIYAADLCTIKTIYSNGWILVTYPTSQNKTRTLYVKAKAFFNSTTYKTASITKYATAYRRSSGSATIGSVNAADKLVYVIGGSVKGRYQIAYKVTNTSTWKLGWVTTSAVKFDNTSTTVSSNTFINESNLNNAASKYKISTASNAYAALKLINTKYASKLTASQKSGTLIFMFEGVGSSSSTSKRQNAMCVVVKAGKIVYINLNSSSLPDYPFTPSKNEGDPMPTLKSGIYKFTTVNHRNSYAALNVSEAKVVRFRSKTNFYSSTSTAINIHRKSSDSVSATSNKWVNSAGCQLVGKTGTESSSEYARFIQAVGIVGSNSRADTKYNTLVSGKYIVDRSYAYNYMRNIGYSDAAIKAIG